MTFLCKNHKCDIDFSLYNDLINNNFILIDLRFRHHIAYFCSIFSSKPVWMSLFCWTQRKIFWRMREREQFWIIVFFSYYGSQWSPETAWLQTFFKISSFVFGRTKTFIQVWNYLRVSKWQNFHFWVKYPFNHTILFKYELNWTQDDTLLLL